MAVKVGNEKRLLAIAVEKNRILAIELLIKELSVSENTPQDSLCFCLLFSELTAKFFSLGNNFRVYCRMQRHFNTQECVIHSPVPLLFVREGGRGLSSKKHFPRRGKNVSGFTTVCKAAEEFLETRKLACRKGAEHVKLLMKLPNRGLATWHKN